MPPTMPSPTDMATAERRILDLEAENATLDEAVTLLCAERDAEMADNESLRRENAQLRQALEAADKLDKECKTLASACHKYNRIAQDAKHRTHIAKKAMEWWRNVARNMPAPPIKKGTVGKFLALVKAENEIEALLPILDAARAVCAAWDGRVMDDLGEELASLAQAIGEYDKRGGA